MAEAAQRGSAFMRPWPREPASVATGILDDETYDWRAVGEGMLATGGPPLVVSEASLRQAGRLAAARAGIPVDPPRPPRPGRAPPERRSGAGARHDRAADPVP